MRKSAALIIAAVWFSLTGLCAAYAGEHQPGQYTNSKEFERWTTFEKGKATGVVTLRLTRMG